MATLVSRLGPFHLILLLSKPAGPGTSLSHSDCLMTVAVGVNASMDYYGCYKEQENESEEESGLLGSCGREEGRNSLMGSYDYRTQVLPCPG